MLVYSGGPKPKCNKMVLPNSANMDGFFCTNELLTILFEPFFITRQVLFGLVDYKSSISHCYYSSCTCTKVPFVLLNPYMDFTITYYCVLA